MRFRRGAACWPWWPTPRRAGSGAAELRQASAELGVTGCTLLDYPDAELPGVPLAELEARVAELAARHRADGLLVFDETGVTGHADHKAATETSRHALHRSLA